MKRLIGLLMIIFAATAVQAQPANPVKWSFKAVKVSDKTYDVVMVASMEGGWHLYSQKQPDDAIAMPTEFKINKNPLFSLEGDIKEKGKMEKFHDAKLDISANQYANQVTFVQTVKLKASAKTNFTGSVQFQTCNDERCLPPKTVSFSVAIDK